MARALLSSFVTKGVLRQTKLIWPDATDMNSSILPRLIEEMMDLKIQQYAESQMRPTPEIARILGEKRETDRRRLEQIRAELVRILSP
jgi:hypothetical protein